MLLGLLTVAFAGAWAGVQARREGRALDPGLPAVQWLPVAVLGLVGQAALDRLHPLGEVLVAGEVVTLAALLAAGIVNAHLPGVVALTAGVVANGAAIVANAGMPVSASAVAAIGGSPAAIPVAGHHHLLDAASRLTGLADVLALRWLGIVVSPGDVLVVAGAVLLLAASLVGTTDSPPAWTRVGVPGPASRGARGGPGSIRGDGPIEASDVPAAPASVGGPG